MEVFAGLDEDVPRCCGKRIDTTGEVHHECVKRVDERGNGMQCMKVRYRNVELGRNDDKSKTVGRVGSCMHACVHVSMSDQ